MSRERVIVRVEQGGPFAPALLMGRRITVEPAAPWTAREATPYRRLIGTRGRTP
jgi:hypothetical protein